MQTQTRRRQPSRAGERAETSVAWPTRQRFGVRRSCAALVSGGAALVFWPCTFASDSRLQKALLRRFGRARRVEASVSTTCAPFRERRGSGALQERKRWPCGDRSETVSDMRPFGRSRPPPHSPGISNSTDTPNHSAASSRVRKTRTWIGPFSMSNSYIRARPKPIMEGQ